MSDLKKKLDKGIAYLKRNGVRKTICRAGRKAVLSREVSYEAWLKGHVADEKELERQNFGKEPQIIEGADEAAENSQKIRHQK